MGIERWPQGPGGRVKGRGAGEIGAKDAPELGFIGRKPGFNKVQFTEEAALKKKIYFQNYFLFSKENHINQRCHIPVLSISIATLLGK